MTDNQPNGFLLQTLERLDNHVTDLINRVSAIETHIKDEGTAEDRKETRSMHWQVLAAGLIGALVSGPLSAYVAWTLTIHH
jgi:hypothetical protein